MPIFPLSKPLSDHELLKTTCHLFVTSLLRVLPFSFLVVAILHFFRYGKAYLPATLQPYYQNTAMILMVLILPLIGVMITLIDKKATETSMSVANYMKEIGVRFVSFLGALISMIFVPLILLGICIAVNFALIYYRVYSQVNFAWLMITPLLVFASMVPNLYAPWLIFSDGLDANDAQAKSNILVKNHFFRTFINGLFAVLVIVFFLQLPQMFHYYFTHIHVNPMLLEWIAKGLLMVVGPWSLVFMLTNKYDLQIRKKEELTDPDHFARKQKVQSAIPVKKSGNVSF